MIRKYKNTNQNKPKVNANVWSLTIGFKDSGINQMCQLEQQNIK